MDAEFTIPTVGGRQCDPFDPDIAIRPMTRPVADKLSRRPVLSDEEWLRQYGSSRTANQSQIALAVISVIAGSLGVRPTQILPTDLVYEDYGFANLSWLQCLLPNDAWELFTTDLATLVITLRKRDLTTAESVRVFEWRTVQDVIDDITEMCLEGRKMP